MHTSFYSGIARKKSKYTDIVELQSYNNGKVL